jgi:methionine-rich copper-binding protein CopC
MRQSLCGAGLLVLAQCALAHAHLENAQPAADSKNAEVRAIRLGFSEALEAKLSAIRIEDREDHAVVEPSAEADPADGKVLVLKLFDKLAPGSYKVRWSVVGADGHKMSGNYTFVVSP